MSSLTTPRRPSRHLDPEFGDIGLKTLGSPGQKKRKPVPTPRNTLRKPKLAQRDVDSSCQLSLDSSSSPDDSGMGDDAKSVHRPSLNGGGEDPEDILAALEKIPGVGSLRSVQSSVGSSLPSLSMERFKREESSHSLGSTQSSGHFSMRSSSDATDPLKRERSLIINGKRRTSSEVEKQEEDKPQILATSTCPPAKPNRVSLSKPTSPSKIAQIGQGDKIIAQKISPIQPDHEIINHNEDKSDENPLEKEDGASLIVINGELSRGDDHGTMKADEKVQRQSVVIQGRPLPDLPELRSTSPRSMASEEEIRVITPTSDRSSRPDHENVYASLISPSEERTQEDASTNHYYSQLSCPEPSLPGRPLPRVGSPESCSLLNKVHRPTSSNYLTLTGTLKRPPSKKKGGSQSNPMSDCVYDVHLNLTSEHITALEKKVHAKYHDRCFCGLQRGIHILLFSLACFPLFWIVATWQAFYLGTLTWYNLFIHYNEDRTFCHKLLSPFVLLAYPLWIIPTTILVGLCGGLSQISWYLDSWRAAIAALDAGFFGWFCHWLNIPECCPYQVILLSAHDYERPPTGATIL